MAETILNKESVQYGTYVEMHTIVCYKCAIPFGVPGTYKKHLRETGDIFYCPNGHSQHYTKSEVTRLQEKLEAQERELKRRIEDRENQIRYRDEKIERITRQKSYVKGQLTKVKNRIKNGVCPCCNRTFSNLHEHMKKQHPEFNEQAI